MSWISITGLTAGLALIVSALTGFGVLEMLNDDRRELQVSFIVQAIAFAAAAAFSVGVFTQTKSFGLRILAAATILLCAAIAAASLLTLLLFSFPGLTQLGAALFAALLFTIAISRKAPFALVLASIGVALCIASALHEIEPTALSWLPQWEAYSAGIALIGVATMLLSMWPRGAPSV